MTLREIKDRVLLNLGEVGNTELEPAIVQEVNNALNKVSLALYLPDLRKVSSVSLPAGQFSYDLSQLGRIRQVYVVGLEKPSTVKRLSYLPPQTLRELYGDPSVWPQTEPLYWTVEGTTLTVAPVPNVASGLVIAWLSWPTPVSSDTDVINPPLDGVVTEYATAMLHASMENLDAYRSWLRIATDSLERLRREFRSPKAFSSLPDEVAQQNTTRSGVPYYLDPFYFGR